MTYPRLATSRPIAAAMFRQLRQRLAYVRQQEQALPQRRDFRGEMVARTCARLRRETQLQIESMRRLLHALFG